MKFLKLLAASALGLMLAHNAAAQTYPSQPVRIILGFGAGSGTDVVARYLAEALGKRFNQSFIVDNRPGAAGNIGLSAGAKAPNDGYTIVLGGLGVNAMNQFLYPPGSMGFDPEKDFDTVILVAKLPFLVTVNPSVPANNINDLVALAKRNPNLINVTVTTTTSRVVYELFNRVSGAQLFPVAYKTPASAMTDVMAGRVHVMIETAASVRPHVTSGKLKALALTSRASSDVMPGVRSAIEQGLKDFEFVGWVSMYMPRGSPRAAINLINSEVNRVLATPEAKARFLSLGLEPGSGTPKDMQDFEESERRRWGTIIKAAGIKAD